MQLLQSGSGVKLLVNGKVVGFATGLSFTRNLNLKVIKEIDNPFAKEITPTSYDVAGSLSGLRISESGGLDGADIMNAATVQNFFNMKYNTIEVVDRRSGKTMYTIQSVMFDQDSWNIQARQLVTFSANFRGVFVSNETTDS